MASQRQRAARLMATAAIALGSVLLTPPPTASAAPAPFQAKIDKAVRDAKARLAERPECNTLLSSNRLADGVSAREALDTATIGYRPVAPSPLPPTAAASAPIGGGLDQVISFHDPFDAIGVTRRLFLGAGPGSRPTTTSTSSERSPSSTRSAT